MRLPLLFCVVTTIGLEARSASPRGSKQYSFYLDNYDDLGELDPYHSKKESDNARDISLGEPGRDYPAYTKLPATGFSCQGRERGYYADEEAGCQVFHVCHNVLVSSFMCPVGLLFSQKLSTCDWWHKVDCLASKQYYDTHSRFYERYDDDEMLRMAHAMAGTQSEEELMRSYLNTEIGRALDDESLRNQVKHYEATTKPPAETNTIRIRSFKDYFRSRTSHRSEEQERAGTGSMYKPTVPTITTTTRRMYSPTVPSLPRTTVARKSKYLDDNYYERKNVFTAKPQVITVKPDIIKTINENFNSEDLDYIDDYDIDLNDKFDMTTLHNTLDLQIERDKLLDSINNISSDSLLLKLHNNNNSVHLIFPEKVNTSYTPFQRNSSNTYVNETKAETNNSTDFDKSLKISILSSRDDATTKPHQLSNDDAKVTFVTPNYSNRGEERIEETAESKPVPVVNFKLKSINFLGLRNYPRPFTKSIIPNDTKAPSNESKTNSKIIKIQNLGPRYQLPNIQRRDEDFGIQRTRTVIETEFIPSISFSLDNEDEKKRLISTIKNEEEKKFALNKLNLQVVSRKGEKVTKSSRALESKV